MLQNIDIIYYKFKDRVGDFGEVSNSKLALKA